MLQMPPSILHVFVFIAVFVPTPTFANTPDNSNDVIHATEGTVASIGIVDVPKDTTLDAEGKENVADLRQVLTEVSSDPNTDPTALMEAKAALDSLPPSPNDELASNGLVLSEVTDNSVAAPDAVPTTPSSEATEVGVGNVVVEEPEVAPDNNNNNSDEGDPQGGEFQQSQVQLEVDTATQGLEPAAHDADADAVPSTRHSDESDASSQAEENEGVMVDHAEDSVIESQPSELTTTGTIADNSADATSAQSDVDGLTSDPVVIEPAEAQLDVVVVSSEGDLTTESQEQQEQLQQLQQQQQQQQQQPQQQQQQQEQQGEELQQQQQGQGQDESQAKQQEEESVPEQPQQHKEELLEAQQEAQPPQPQQQLEQKVDSNTVSEPKSSPQQQEPSKQEGSELPPVKQLMPQSLFLHSEWLGKELLVVLPLFAVHCGILLAFAQLPLSFFRHLTLASRRRLLIYKLVSGTAAAVLVYLYWRESWLWLYGTIIAFSLLLLFKL